MSGTDEHLAPEGAAESLPPEGRRKAGPYPLFECFQEIPCNPCATACPQGVVEEFEDINDLPRLDYDAHCTACAQCVAVCPGLSCFLVDETYSQDEATITLAYEILPLPEDGQEVIALDREGRAVGHARVIRVRNRTRTERTPLVTLAIPKDQILVVRNFRAGGEG
jgi:Fe-S-cluster-containing hydrogenase component 2